MYSQEGHFSCNYNKCVFSTEVSRQGINNNENMENINSMSFEITKLIIRSTFLRDQPLAIEAKEFVELSKFGFIIG